MVMPTLGSDAQDIPKDPTEQIIMYRRDLGLLKEYIRHVDDDKKVVQQQLHKYQLDVDALHVKVKRLSTEVTETLEMVKKYKTRWELETERFDNLMEKILNNRRN